MRSRPLSGEYRTDKIQFTATKQDKAYMLIILILLSVSAGLGYLMRKLRPVARFSGAVRYTVFAMLFVFGIIVGSDSGLMSNLGEFSLQATIIALAGIVGSISATCLLNRISSGKEKKK